MAYYKATIDILVDVDSEPEACDAIAEAMRPLLQKFTPTSSVIDWKYTDSVLNHPVLDTGEEFEYAND